MRLKLWMTVLIPAVATAQSVSPGEGPGRVVQGVSAAPAGADAQSQKPADPDLIAQQSGGSMLRATVSTSSDPMGASYSAVSFFTVPEAKPRMLKKHDLVTIIVDEASTYSSAGTTDLQKSADFDAKINAMIRLSLKNLSLSENGTSAIPEINTSGTRDFKGDGAVNRTDSLTTRITAEVLDVKPNGTLVLQARQHIKTDDEEQTMILSGNCRVEDVTPDNTVLSSQMFDKDVTKSNKGAVRDTMKRGWVPKLLDVINPF
jgi:flagellar L-ring protein precursor FlgH